MLFFLCHLLRKRGKESAAGVNDYVSSVRSSGGGVPDEAGPGVAAGVAKVDDEGKVAVVDTDLGETNDASDALLFAMP